MKPNINFQLIKQLELPTETKKELTQGGIYRIYITNPKNNQQQSYIGISSNIFYRLTQHRRIINQLKENKKIKINKEEQQHLLNYFLEFYELEDISNNYTMYKKLQMKLTEFNLTYADIKIEILEFIKDYKNMELIKIEAKEQEYINHFNAEKQGVNDILNYKLKLAAAELTATPEQLEKIKKQEKDKQQNNKKMLINALKNNEQINKWLYWQLKVFNKWLDVEDGTTLLKKYKKTNEWSEYCKEMIKKIQQNAEVEIKKLLKELKQDYKKIINNQIFIKLNNESIILLNEYITLQKTKTSDEKYKQAPIKWLKNNKKINRITKEYYKKLDYTTHKIYLFFDYKIQKKYITKINKLLIKNNKIIKK